MQILLESGAHINWQNTAGETALIRVSFISKKKLKPKAMSTTYTMPDAGLIPVAFRFDRCVPVLAPICSLSLRSEYLFPLFFTLHQSVAQLKWHRTLDGFIVTSLFTFLLISIRVNP